MAHDTIEDLARGVLATLAYAGIGSVVLALGYVVLDKITPGDLRHLVYTHRNKNAAVIAAAHLVALAAIVTTAILTSSDDLGQGALEASAYGLVGIALLAGSFKLVDLATPGELGRIVTDEAVHPATWVTAAFQLSLGAVLAAAIS
jgi:uncharacterized membrane protein YjfL (UPF0719 family)